MANEQAAPLLDEDLPLEIYAGRCPPLKATKDEGAVVDDDLPLEIYAGRCPPLKATRDPEAGDELQPLILDTVQA